jgi:hypothetical protein
MDPLAVNAIGPVSLSALSGLRPVQALGTPVALKDAATLSLQGLAQGFFQQALQASAGSVLAEPATGSVALAQEAGASLLAALGAAPVEATPTATAAVTPPALPAPPEAPAPTATPPASVPAEPQAVADPFAAGSSLEFALQTALRFGAGVAALATPGLAPAGQGTGLVRDAAAVSRIGNLQSHTGGPGPEAFAHPQAPIQRALSDYRPAPTTPGTGQVDLLV